MGEKQSFLNKKPPTFICKWLIIKLPSLDSPKYFGVNFSSIKSENKKAIISDGFFCLLPFSTKDATTMR
jgi:hypothetical protein